MTQYNEQLEEELNERDTKKTISVVPIRNAVLKYMADYNQSYSDIARTIGWVRKRDGTPETNRLTIAIGVRLEHSGGRHAKREKMYIKTAETIILALDIDPKDVGI